MSIDHRTMIAPGNGHTVQIGGLEVINKLTKTDTSGAFAVVEHPLAPGHLAAPPHTHVNEDEYSYILEGQVGFRVGEQDFTAIPGSYVLKPRGVPHTFWNPGPAPARVIEIISPAGFEAYFVELAAILAACPVGAEPDFGAIMALGARYGLTFHMEQLPDLLLRHGLRLG